MQLVDFGIDAKGAADEGGEGFGERFAGHTVFELPVDVGAAFFGFEGALDLAGGDMSVAVFGGETT